MFKGIGSIGSTVPCRAKNPAGRKEDRTVPGAKKLTGSNPAGRDTYVRIQAGVQTLTRFVKGHDWGTKVFYS